MMQSAVTISDDFSCDELLVGFITDGFDCANAVVAITPIIPMIVNARIPIFMATLLWCTNSMKLPAAAYSAEAATSATKAGSYGVFGQGESHFFVHRVQAVPPHELTSQSFAQNMNLRPTK